MVYQRYINIYDIYICIYDIYYIYIIRSKYKAYYNHDLENSNSEIILNGLTLLHLTKTCIMKFSAF